MSAKYLNKLRNKRILVVGGTSGIGFAVAEACIEYGAQVVIASSTTSKIDAAIDRIRSSNPNGEARIRGFPIDLSSDQVEDQLKKLFDLATNNGEHLLDHIVETAGNTLNPGSLKQTRIDAFDELGRVRVMGPMMMAKLAKKYLVDSHTSSLTLTGGISGVKPSNDRAVLAGIASAKEGITRGLAIALKPIRVNIVTLGPVKTELLEGLATRLGTPLQVLISSFAEKTLTGTVGAPEDIAESYLALMKNHFMTGSVTYAEGGTLLV